MIRLTGVRKAYSDGEGRHQVLDGVDLEVASGEFVAILGSSGSGKSTLLNIIGGLDGDFEGEVEVDGRALHRLEDKGLSRFRGATVGFVFQSFNLISEISALENVGLPGWFDRGVSSSKASVLERATEVLKAVDLSSKTHRRPDHLSGGERQRVAIARALFSNPKMLLCDEPTGNLDASTGRDVIDLFRVLNKKGMTLLMVTHEARIAEAAGRLFRLSDGRLQEITDERDDHSRLLGQVTDEAGK